MKRSKYTESGGEIIIKTLLDHTIGKVKMDKFTDNEIID